MATPERIYINDFKISSGLLDPVEVWLVVKSQDQIERRERMVGQLKRGEKIGRIRPRPIAEGLLIKYQFPPNGNNQVLSEGAELVTRFPEPRHIVPYARDRYLLTEIGRVNLIDAQGRVLDTFSHPYFAFLHTVVLNQSRDRILVTSGGYDAILELDVRSKEESWRWFGWDHGFNPNEENVYYTNTLRKAEQLEAKGYVAKYIDPAEYNEQGLVTASRTTHPNVAFYNPYKSEATVIASLGYGKIVEIDRHTSEYQVMLDAQVPVLHGIMPYDQGWIVTNTCRGEFWVLDKEFKPLQEYVFSQLPGKPEEVGDCEWLQLVIPISKDRFLGLDANRGIIICDTVQHRYEVLHPDPNWCLQDVLISNDIPAD